jgi:acyl-CoA dehydrogenase
MALFGWFLLFVGALGTLSFQRASLSVWTITFAVLLYVLDYFSSIHAGWMVALWALYLAIFVVLNIKFLRRILITRYILRIFRRVMPKMSKTEKEALSAGGVGWEGDLFQGKPDWDKLQAIKLTTLTKEEQEFLDGPVESLCGMIDNWAINHQGFNIPDTIWEYLKKEGFLGLIIPKKYGGKGFGATAHSQIIAKLSSVSTAVAVAVSVPNSLGPGELLLHYGTKVQKDHYLPKLAKGEEIPCFALTSPVAGSDAGAIVDYGIVCRRELAGEQTLGVILNWNKRYITLAPIATLLGLAFKLYDPEGLLGGEEKLGITCALIPVDLPGVKIGRRHYPLCSAFPNGPTQGKDVFIPIDQLIGGKKMAGQGWRMLMECLAAGRGISLPSMTCGGAKKAVYATGAYARLRHQFNTSIGAFEGVQEKLASMGGSAYMAEALRLFMVTAIDDGDTPSVASAISKYHTTELSREVLQCAMDIQGGKGICMGPNNYLAQSYIESPISITVEGANILTRSMIIFGQGVIRCHPYVLKEITAAEEKNSAKGLREFDQAMFSHMNMLVSNMTRSFCLGLSNGVMAQVPSGNYKRYYQKLSRYAAGFSLVSDAAMLTLGGALKRKESLSARLGDILSYLYISSAVLKYSEAKEDDNINYVVEWICQDLFWKIEQSFDGFLINLPSRWVGKILRPLTLPLGRRARKPSDELTNKVANLLMKPSVLRDCMADNVYLKDDGTNPVGKIKEALEQNLEVEPLRKLLYKAQREGLIAGKDFYENAHLAVELGVLKKDEHDQLVAAFNLAMQVIMVDDFDPNELH